MTTPVPTRRQRRARATLFWAAAALVLGHICIHFYREKRHPEAYDPEFASRLVVLRERLAESPDRPLLLVVGSSRLVTNFRPEQLPPVPASDGLVVLPFNFSHTGAGPLVNLMEVRRLVRAGVHPRWLVIEVMPPMLNVSGCSMATGIAEADDLQLLCEYMPRWKAYAQYLRSRVVPHRQHYYAALVGRDSPEAASNPEAHPLSLDRLGGSSPLLNEATPAEVRSRTDAMRGLYAPALQHFRISPVADRSLREVLTLCRAEGIGATLLLTPESSEFSSWYPDATRQTVDEYCAALRQDYGVPVIDARTWIADRDFLDGHHALPRGVRVFTRRLNREVLQPLIAGRLSP